MYNAHRLYTYFSGLHILPDYFSNLAEQQLSVPSREYTIPNSYVFGSRALSPDQYHADNIPPLNTETISDRSNPPGVHFDRDENEEFHVNGPNESANRI
jgi:hypothetical protein